MDGTEYEAFKADVRANGCRNPVWLHQGQVIDGRNRLRACRELGIEPTFAEYAGDDPAGFVESMNLHRRHLPAKFRDQRIRERRAKGESIRTIAEAEGVGKGTVERAINSSVPSGTLDPTQDEPAARSDPPQVIGKNGRKYQPRREPSVESKIADKLKKGAAHLDDEELALQVGADPAEVARVRKKLEDEGTIARLSTKPAELRAVLKHRDLCLSVCRHLGEARKSIDKMCCGPGGTHLRRFAGEDAPIRERKALGGEQLGHVAPGLVALVRFVRALMPADHLCSCLGKDPSCRHCLLGVLPSDPGFVPGRGDQQELFDEDLSSEDGD